MNDETRYRYEKRIHALEAEVERLLDYRRVALNIFATTVDVVQDGKQISNAWIIKQFREVMK